MYIRLKNKIELHHEARSHEEEVRHTANNNEKKNFE